MSWTSTVLPLAGVILGAGSTLLGQHLVLRVDVRRDAARQAAEQRAERKEAIIGFLAAAERVEQRRGTPSADDDDGPSLAELMHNVWLAKKVVELACSCYLAQAAHDYARGLSPFSHEPGRKAPGKLEPLTPREEQLRAEFMEPARQEMGYAGDRLRRMVDRDRQQSPDSEAAGS